MSKNLVIVESPAKARTIERYLGPGYMVLASYGHVRDLPENPGKNKLGVDVEHDFKPEYVISEDRKKQVAAIAKEAKTADTVYLATDLDREGEAIAWHVAEAANVSPEKARRVTFSEITADAIREAFENPREIDHDLVDAQQARRILDRLVGYTLSPLLWRKVRSGLSAGRVQSVAVRLVVEREREINAFTAREYWTIQVILETDTGEQFTAEVAKIDGETLATDAKFTEKPDKFVVITDEAAANEHADVLRGTAGRRSPMSAPRTKLALLRRRSRHPRCSRRRAASSVSTPSGRCASPRTCTRAWTPRTGAWASSPTCEPTRRTWRMSRWSRRAT